MAYTVSNSIFDNNNRIGMEPFGADSMALENTPENITILEQMLKNVGAYRLDAILKRMKDPFDITSLFQDGRIAFFAYRKFQYFSGIDDLFEIWKKNSSGPLADGCAHLYPSDGNGEYIICRVSPLLASIITERYDLCRKYLERKDYGSFSASDLIMDTYITEQKKDSIVGDCLTTASGISHDRIDGQPMLRHLVYACMTREKMPDDLRLELIVRLQEAIVSMDTGAADTTVDGTLNSLFMTRCQPNRAFSEPSVADSYYWPKWDNYHPNDDKKLLIGMRTFRLLKKHHPEVFDRMFSNNIYRELVLGYYSKCMIPSQMQGNTTGETWKAVQKAPQNFVKELKSLYSYTDHPLYLFQQMTGNSSFFNSSLLSLLVDERECRRFSDFWFMATGQRLVLDCMDTGIREWFDQFCNTRVFSNGEHGCTALKTLLRLVDKVLTRPGFYQKQLAQWIINERSPELMILALQKDLIRTSDTQKYIRLARERQVNALIPLLILKHNGEWNTEE